MSRYTLAQLEAFYWIVQLGGFHPAAERLNVTQPTISLRIRELESALGARLFERRGSALRLSVEGSVMLQYVERALGVLGEMKERLHTGDPLQGSLRLGTSDMFAMTCLPEIIGTLEEKFPRLKIELTVNNSVALADMLNRKQLDLAFLAESRLHLHVRTEPLGLADIAWLGSANKKLRVRTLRPQALSDTAVLTMPAPSPLNEILMNWYAEGKAPAPVLSTCNNMSVIARLIGRGLAMSILPLCAVANELEAGMLVRYRELPRLQPLTLCAAYQAAAQGPGISAVLRIARRVVDGSHFFRALPR